VRSTREKQNRQVDVQFKEDLDESIRKNKKALDELAQL
jgi:hypothetical protein